MAQSLPPFPESPPFQFPPPLGVDTSVSARMATRRRPRLDRRLVFYLASLAAVFAAGMAVGLAIGRPTGSGPGVMSAAVAAVTDTPDMAAIRVWFDRNMVQRNYRIVELSKVRPYPDGEYSICVRYDVTTPAFGTVRHTTCVFFKPDGTVRNVPFLDFPAWWGDR